MEEESELEIAMGHSLYTHQGVRFPWQSLYKRMRVVGICISSLTEITPQPESKLAGKVHENPRSTERKLDTCQETLSLPPRHLPCSPQLATCCREYWFQRYRLGHGPDRARVINLYPVSKLKIKTKAFLC